MTHAKLSIARNSQVWIYILIVHDRCCRNLSFILYLDYMQTLSFRHKFFSIHISPYSAILSQKDMKKGDTDRRSCNVTWSAESSHKSPIEFSENGGRAALEFRGNYSDLGLAAPTPIGRFVLGSRRGRRRTSCRSKKRRHPVASLQTAESFAQATSSSTNPSAILASPARLTASPSSATLIS